MDRIKRIKEMEEILDNGNLIAKEFLDSYEKLINYQASLKRLEKYYTDGDYLADYEADERKDLPSDLKRGVLDEDSIYELLNLNDYIMGKILKK